VVFLFPFAVWHISLIDICKQTNFNIFVQSGKADISFKVFLFGKLQSGIWGTLFLYNFIRFIPSAFEKLSALKALGFCCFSIRVMVY